MSAGGSSAQSESRRHDVAVSFAGEDRGYVSKVVDAVRPDFAVFYDEDFQAESWGEDGVEYFTNVYMNEARYVLMFISSHYAEKVWTRVEKRAALARAVTERSAYVLPVKLDDTELHGMPPTVIHLDARVLGLENIIRLLREKLGGEGGQESEASSSPRDPDDWKVPRTAEEMQLLLEERPPGWEYWLWAGALKLGLERREPKYRDHVSGYSESTGQLIDNQVDFLEYTQLETQEGLHLSQNFAAILSEETQTAAFGLPGEPGDPDRIVHMAERFLGVYEGFLDWAARLRGVPVTGEHARTSLRALADTATENVEELRAAVGRVVAWADDLNAPRPEGEMHALQMTVTLTLDEALMETFRRERELALQGELLG